MLAWLHDWQELASGLLALLAGAFIFIQGRLERKALKQLRFEELAQEARRTEIILERLKQAAAALVEEIDSYLELLSDVLDALDRGDDQVELPPKVLVPRVFEIMFAQLTTREVPIDIYLQLSALLERGIAIDEDFRRLIVTYSGTVTEHRPVQPRLPLAEGQVRCASEEPAAQGVIVSVTALQEVAGELVGLIDALFEGDGVNVSNVRTSVQHLEQV
jgi:hypothetical protein